MSDRAANTELPDIPPFLDRRGKTEAKSAPEKVKDAKKVAAFAPLSPDEKAARQKCGPSTHKNGGKWWPIQPVPADAPEPSFVHPTHGKPASTWPYRAEDGSILYWVARFDRPGGGKEVLPYTICETNKGQRAWQWKAPPKPRSLYGLNELAKRPNAPVLITEGEKAADAAMNQFPDHVAVTSQGGSRAASKADWWPLRGRAVAIWPDNDDPGRRYAEDAAKLAREAGAESVSIVAAAEAFPKGWDLADPLPDGVTGDDLHRMLSEAKPWAGPEDTTPNSLLQTLADLPPIEYDQQRKMVAEQMGVRVSTLDAEVALLRPPFEQAAATDTMFLKAPEPWADPVVGNELLDGLTDVIRRFLILPSGAAEAIALWVVFAHAFEAFQISPILALLSPEKRCGKTTTLSVIQQLVPKGLMAASITPASVFRSVEKYRPTLLVDEADTFLRSHDELRGVLNSGHNRSGAFVVRTTGDDHEPQLFSTWAPKVIAMIGRLPDTLEDRSVVVPLKRKRPDERVDPFRFDREAVFVPLLRKAARWVADNLNALAAADPEVPMGLNDRQADNWRPLLAIADLAGQEWSERARAVAAEFCAVAVTDDETGGVALLEDIRSVFDADGVSVLPTRYLLEGLIKMEERPWAEWQHGRQLTPRQLAGLLKPYGITPDKWNAGSGTVRGYRRADFEDAFTRYLNHGSATSATTLNSLGDPEF